MADVVVVGAGIVGAAVAYEAARAGADVVLLDGSVPASGVTGDSFAWIGGPRSWDVPDASSPLRRAVLPDWRRLEREVPGLRVRWTGSLRWGGASDAEAHGPDEDVLDDAGVARLEPHLSVPPARALHVTSDGAVDPVAATRALVDAARDRGADVRVRCMVAALRLQDGGVVGVESSAGFLPSVSVVLAAGTQVPALCAPLGLDLPVASSPAVLVRLAAPPGLVRTLIATSEFEVREVAPGELLVALAYDGGTGTGTGTGTDDVGRIARDAVRRLASAFGTDDLRPSSARVGARPMPADGLPVLGPVPGVTGAYLAVMHSGVTLAPAAARLVAAEIVHGVEAAELAGLRPHRFL